MLSKKFTLSAFTLFVLSSSVYAVELKPTDMNFGTASAEIIAVLPQVWRVSNSSSYDVRLDRNGKISSDAILAGFTVKNLTSSAGKYYISAEGSSKDLNGKFVAYPAVTDGSQSSFSVKPVVNDANGKFVFNSLNKHYEISRELTAQNFDKIFFKVDSSGETINPGLYYISLELFAPAV